MMLGTFAPVLEARLRRPRDLPGLLRLLTGTRGLAGLAPPLPAKSLDLLGAALTEVLRSVLDFAGPKQAEAASVELWVGPGLAVVALRFAGPPLPEWLIRNWDRGVPPAVLTPPGDYSWGWLTVREALDSVVQMPGRRATLLFLEKRL